MRGARVRKWVLRTLTVLLLPAAGFLGWNLATDNFATVRAGQVYRAGQMEANALARALRRERIRTVLNLRGSHPDVAWYRAERKAALDAGATQVDVAMSSCEWMSRAQLRALVSVLETCERPVLVHCWRGSERTGLVAAMTELLRPGGSLAEARAQFSLRYLFVRAGDGKVMAEHLDQYESWLRRQGLAHSPDQFRRWVADGFRPRKPGREDWPYDPYPLVVVTRPESKPDRVAAKSNPSRQ
jgi:hypothetical protein